MIFILIIISQIQSNDSSSFSDKDNFMIGQNFHIKTSSNSPIISINSNNELNQTATSGNGTIPNPYVIEGLTINGNGSLYCILINNTNKFFILKNCNLINSTYGIYLNNVTNGEVSFNLVSDNINSGLIMKSSFNNTVLCNLFQSNNFSGIFLFNSNFNEILVNSIDYHQYALILDSSNYSSVIGNSGINNIIGIKEVNCSNNSFVDNEFRSSIRDINSDSNSKSDKKISLDYTFILFICLLSIFIIMKIRNLLGT